MLFNGTWYCYYQVSVSAGSYSTVANNYCDSVKSGSTVIKALSYREYRYVYYIDTSTASYVGLIYPGASAYTW